MIKPVPGAGNLPTFTPPVSAGNDPFAAISHAPHQLPPAAKSFATNPLSGVTLPQNANLFGPLVEQITKQDVFFSDQSFRAQLHRYMAVQSGTPWMFSYSRQASPSVLDMMFTPNKSVLLITPVNDADEDEQEKGSQRDAEDESRDEAADQDTQQLDSSEIVDLLAESSDSSDAILADVDPSDEFALFNAFLADQEKRVSSSRSTLNAASALASAAAKETVESVITPPNGVSRFVLQQLFGHYLDAQHYAQLTEAYEKTKDYPDQCLWVRHYQDSIDVLGPQPPYQHGLHQVKRPVMQAAMDWVSPLACRYLECYEEDEFLFLPNGGMVSLRPLAWVDGEDRYAKVFRVKRMPNGMWFKVEAVRRQTDFKATDVAQIKRTMEDWNQSLESIGWLRDVS